MRHPAGMMRLASLLATLMLLAAASSQATQPARATVGNPAAYIPSQCYTQTRGADGTIHNTCYPCHTHGLRPEFVNDSDLQLAYDVATPAETNPWTNLFRDHGAQIAAIDDRQMLDHVRRSNYLDAAGDIALATVLRQPPASWDVNGDGHWGGYVPDCFFRFDAEGFDRNPTGAITGWRAFAFYPFPSTHWPSNGSFVDVLLRLPAPFRNCDQRYDAQVYKINLAILETLIKRQDIAIPETDERILQVDLDRDGQLGRASRIAFDWAPLEGRQMSWVGDARDLQQRGEVHLAAGLFPEGTEFLSSLHYLDVDPNGRVSIAPRLKELRYLRKVKWLTYAQLETLAMNEIKEKNDFPDRLRLPLGGLEEGLSNGKGWVAQGFIEARDGTLRPQDVEETFSCIGCHGGIGATSDSIFSLPRKLDVSNHQAGWFHWSQRGLENLNEPKVEFDRLGVQYEYCFYLMYARASDEFRANSEHRDRFWNTQGQLRADMAAKLHEDLSILLLPSAQRALNLNKAYQAIVAEQSFRLGRETLLGDQRPIYQRLEQPETPTGITQPLTLSRQPRDVPPRPLELAGGAALDPAAKSAISGNGMAGPSGMHYSLNQDGQIELSRYAQVPSAYYFPFPPRHTLPTRMIVPNGTTASCYECHRLLCPMPSGMGSAAEPVALPATSGDSAGLERLTDHPAADLGGVWSPDGQWIAWVSRRSGSFQIWLMRRDGTQPRQLTHEPARHGWPAWSPDGAHLAVWGYDPSTGESSISIVDSRDGRSRVLVRSQESLDRPAWRPDGRYIAYGEQRGGNWDIWVASIESDRRHRLTHDPQMETNPLWSPDGSTIAYKVAPDKEYNLTVEHFVSVRAGFDRPQYTAWNGIQSIQMNAWSPDGKRIAYTAEVITNASGEDRVSYRAIVEPLPAQGSQHAGLPAVLAGDFTLGDRGPVFSPSGERVCFWAWDRSYQAGLWIANVDGSGLKQLTRAGMDMVPQWSPDGSTILFESGRGGNLDLWTIAVP